MLLFSILYLIMIMSQYLCLMNSMNSYLFIFFIAAIQAAVIPYGHCDQSNQCSLYNSNLQCFDKQCVPKVCLTNADCASRFNCINRICEPTFRENPDVVPYCDFWTPCSNVTTCQFNSNKCMVITCTSNMRCPNNFVCRSGKCQPTTYIGIKKGFCDSYTPCPGTYQCKNGGCWPKICQINFDCASGFTCRNNLCV